MKKWLDPQNNIEDGDNLEEKLEKIEDRIKNYVPDTAWEVFDHKELKQLKKYRNKLIKAIERQKQKEKTIANKSLRKLVQLSQDLGFYD
ncbi:MAG: hypothetical protein DWQ19_10350 [Crenarchaeota archaeon]|nr:MAG: hypothetical protein DWQ19_10350 [Thermoproteota archaeon]